MTVFEDGEKIYSESLYITNPSSCMKMIKNKFYEPLRNAYLNYSPIFTDLISKTKNVPITRKHLSSEELKASKTGKGDVAKYEVKGFDDVVSAENFDKKLSDEFCCCFIEGSKSFMKWLKGYIYDVERYNKKNYVISDEEENEAYNN